MTEGACTIPTPEQARFGAPMAAIEGTMLEKVVAALKEAHEAASRLPPVQDGDPPMPLDYFTAVAHHWLFTTFCGADPDRGKGGDPAVAFAVLRNFQGLTESWESNSSSARSPRKMPAAVFGCGRARADDAHTPSFKEGRR